jgi:hypothetical protein
MIATIIGFLLLIISYINGYFLLERLKTTHYDVWFALKKPRLGDSNVNKKWWTFLKFIWGGKFLYLNDSQLTFLCFSAIFLELGIFIAFMFVLFV